MLASSLNFGSHPSCPGRVKLSDPYQTTSLRHTKNVLEGSKIERKESVQMLLSPQWWSRPEPVGLAYLGWGQPRKRNKQTGKF